MKAGSSPVLVLGMHRSGTSLLTGCLQAAGLYLGVVNDKAPHNRRGNKENEAIRDWHEERLNQRGLSWRLPPEDGLCLSAEERQQLATLLKVYETTDQVWGVKDPRLVWFVEEWLTLFPDATMIGVFRHPSLVVGSLGARPGILFVPEGEALDLWLRTNKRILDLKQKYDFPLLHYASENRLEQEFFAPLEHFCRDHGLMENPRRFYKPSLTNQKDVNDRLPEPVFEVLSRLNTECEGGYSAGNNKRPVTETS